MLHGVTGREGRLLKAQFTQMTTKIKKISFLWYLLFHQISVISLRFLPAVKSTEVIDIFFAMVNVSLTPFPVRNTTF